MARAKVKMTEANNIGEPKQPRGERSFGLAVVNLKAYHH